MLETIMKQQIIFYAMGVTVAVGVLSRLISHVTLRRLVRAAGKMNKSNHKLMKLIKAKFEHASMLSDKVQNVQAFLRKYIYEYKVFGIHLYTWRRLQIKAIWFTAILGAAGMAAGYVRYGVSEQMLNYGAWAGAGIALLFLLHISGDENYRLEMMENYMIDFLENVCAHRYERQHHAKEMRQEVVLPVEEAYFAETVQEEVSPVEEMEVTEEHQEEPKKEKNSQEVRIRKILEEFLA